jgi:hypothetical protein
MRARRLVVLIALVLATLACGASAAAALSPPAQKLRAIVRADGRSAKASPIVRPGGIATALVFHALQVTVVRGYVASEHSLADIYRYTGGRWHRIARVDFGKDSLGTNLQAPPRHVELTGATDFAVSFEAAGAAPISIVSDAGGRWRAVPFVQPGQPTVTSVQDGSIVGDTVVSSTHDCIPNCAQGKRTEVTWHYDAAVQAFEPYTPPSGPCSNQTLTSGEIQAIGCFTGPTSGVYSTTQTFRLNGLQVAPDPGTTLTFDPSNRTGAVTASGSGCLQTMVTAIFNLGEFDLKCWTKSAAISFPNNKLVLHSVFASSPAGNFYGLPFVYDEITLEPGGAASIQGAVGLLPVYGNPLANASFSATTNNAHGLTIGQMCARINPGTFGVSIPLKIKGVSIPLRSASLCFLPGLQELAGSATIALGAGSPQVKGTLAFHVGSLPAPGSVTLPFTNVNISFAGLEVGLQGINQELFDGIFLQQAAAGFYIYPRPELTGEIGLSVGPQINLFKIRQGIAALEAVGSFSYTWGGDNGFSDFFFANNPDNYSADTSTPGSNTLNVDGKLYVGGTNYSAFATLASAHATFRSQGKSTLTGYIDTDGFPLVPSLDAKVKGIFEASHYTAYGSGSWSEFGASIADGAVLLSDKGVAGCATISSIGDAIIGGFSPVLGYLAGTTPIGFRYVKGSGFSLFYGCNLSDLATVSGVTSSSTTRQISIPRGRSVEEIAVHGTTGPPAALISGPGGRNLPAPSQVNRLTAEDGALVVADTSDETTYYLIGKPKPGRWQISPAEGASPISSVSTAGQLSGADVRARVSGHGRDRRLSWHFRGAAGRTVVFVAVGTGAFQTLTTTSHGHGSARFNALAGGSAGKRTIVAIVEQDGFQRSQSTVARYRAQPPARLGPVRGLRVRRHGRSVTISWRRVGGARAYMVTVHFHHHEQAEFALPARTTSETIKTGLAGTASVYAGASGRRPGASRSARFRAGH